jgi:hypothetical protein
MNAFKLFTGSDDASHLISGTLKPDAPDLFMPIMSSDKI